MRIGIDISQMVYEGTGVARYVRELVASLIKEDTQNEYVLFGASLRKRDVFTAFAVSLDAKNVRLVTFPFSPSMLDFLWNRLHIIPIESFIGPVDVFWSSDWTQPPLRSAKGITTIHDVSFLRFPDEHASIIFEVHKRRLVRAKKECQIFLCDSDATKKDVMKYLQIAEEKLRVVYPGFRPFGGTA
jgi:hypothetical protein